MYLIINTVSTPESISSNIIPIMCPWDLHMDEHLEELRNFYNMKLLQFFIDEINGDVKFGQFSQ